MFRVRKRTLAGIGAIAVFAIVGPLIAPFSPTDTSAAPLLPPSWTHLFGTNDVGQDNFSAWLWAGRQSLTVAILVTAISILLSWSAGVLSAVSRVGALVLLPIIDLLLAIPQILLLLLILSMVGSSTPTIVLVLSLVSWAGYARIVRAETLAIRSEPYLEAIRAIGADEARVVLVHVLPATLDLLRTKVVMTMRFAIVAEATLAFLGLGDPTTKSWGGILGIAFSDPLLFLRPNWWIRIGPAVLSIVVVVLMTYAFFDMDHQPDSDA